MSTLILRVAGTVLALLGLVGVVIGGWFLAAIGTSGTATFTTDPGQRVVVLEPDVLNRVDAPIEVIATGGGEMWAGTARPSDVVKLIGEGARAEVTGVDVSEWELKTTTAGKDSPIDPRGLDIWQASETRKGAVTATIDQAEAPQSLVLSAPEGEEITELEFVVAEKRWGGIALTVFIIGLLLLLAGLALLALTTGLVRRRQRPVADSGHFEAPRRARQEGSA